MITVALRQGEGRHAYEGPLDLLVALVRRGGYPLDRLPVGAITGEYNRCLREAGQADLEADMELGGEFVEAASWLVLLKSRALLPPAPGEAGEEPARELARALLDHAALQKAAALLRERLDTAGLLAAGIGGRLATPPSAPKDPEQDKAGPAPPTMQDVLAAARRAVAAAGEHGRALDQAATFASEDPYPVERARALVEARLQTEPTPGETVSTAPWFEELADPQARAALLLALLELAREGRLVLHQPAPLATVWLRKFGEARTPKTPG